MTQNLTEHSNKIRWVYDSENNSELTQRYEEWASDYDRDIVAKYGYVGPRVTTQQFELYVPKTGKILDAGAGTGLVGQELYRLGYHDIEGMDMSPAMLDQAAVKTYMANCTRWSWASHWTTRPIISTQLSASVY